MGCNYGILAKIVAILYLVSSVLTILFGLAMTYGFANMIYKGDKDVETMVKEYLPKQGPEDERDVKEATTTVNGTTFVNGDLLAFVSLNMGVYTGVMFVGLGLVWVFASIELWQGVKEKNYWRVNAFFRFHLANTIAAAITLPALVLVTLRIMPGSVSQLICLPLSLLINVILLLVVYKFMRTVHQNEEEKYVRSKF